MNLPKLEGVKKQCSMFSDLFRFEMRIYPVVLPRSDRHRAYRDAEADAEDGVS